MPVTNPAVSLSKDKSKYNGWVVASLSGFTPNSDVTLSWPRRYEITSGPYKGQMTSVLVTGRTDAGGRVTLRFRTPMEPLGDYSVTAEDTARRSATTVLRVIPRIMLNETSGPSDTRLRVYFYGFAANEVIEVRWHSTNSLTSPYVVIKQITVADNGRASTLVPIPETRTLGDKRIVGKVVGISRSASTAFRLTGISAATVDDPTPTPTATPTATPEPTATPDPTPTPTVMPEPTVEATPEPEPTETPVPAPVGEPTPEPEPTPESPPVEPSPESAP